MISSLIHLGNRGIIRVGGPDRSAFLQGLISNDIHLCKDGKAIYAALLTPQGKFLHDMFVVQNGETYLLDIESARAEDLLQRLAMYKLRSKVTLENTVGDYAVWADIPLVPDGDGGTPPALPPSSRAGEQHSSHFDNRGFIITYQDPRLPELGTRFITSNLADMTAPPLPQADFTVYDRYRLSLGVPDGSRDMIIGKSTLLESNLDRLNAISLTKGCYMGQELTARMHYRALVKKRLFPVSITGPAPELGQIIKSGDTEIGEMRSSCGDVGLALLNVEFSRNPLKQANQLIAEKSVIRIL